MNRPLDIFDDLAALRIDQNDLRLAPKTSYQRPKAKRQRRFIIVPRIWMLQLRSAKKVTTYRVALLLLYEHWRNGGQPVRVTNALAAEFGVLRRSKHSALEELKQLNLIEVERGPRTAPLVTPLLSSA